MMGNEIVSTIAEQKPDGTVEAADGLCCDHAMGADPGPCCPHCTNCSMHETTNGRCCHHKMVEDWGMCCPDCTECDYSDEADEGYGPGWGDEDDASS